MDAGLDSHPSEIERVVRAAEARIVIRNRWYRHRVVWGVCGLAIGLTAGSLWQQALMPPRVDARSASVPSKPNQYHFESELAAARVLAALNRPRPLIQPAVQVPKKEEAPTVAHPLPSGLEPLPRVLPHLEGSIDEAGPVTPEVSVAPMSVDPPKLAEPTAEELERRAKEREVKERIASLRLQRDELLKSFYEDAIPVKHVDEDIATAERELSQLAAKSRVSSKGTNG